MSLPILSFIPQVKCLLFIIMATPRGLAVILYAILGLKSTVSVGDSGSDIVLETGTELIGTGQSPLPRNSSLASDDGTRGRRRDKE